MNKGAGIIWVNIIMALCLAACGGSARTAATHTPTNPAASDTPIATPTAPATATLTPVNTSTSAATAAPIPTDTALPPVATDTPAAPATAAAPLPTATTAPLPVPAPQLVSPVYGVYKNPLVFKWSGARNVSYQVTLRHLDNGITHTSGYMAGFEWAFDIPAEQFGNWEWFVTNSNGSRSGADKFVFDPSGGSGGNSAPPDVPPPPTRSVIKPPGRP
jgi:hypothetical protein